MGDPGERRKRLVVAVVSTNAEAGRSELHGIERAAARAGWTLETIDPAQTGPDLSPFAPLVASADGVIARDRPNVMGVFPLLRPGTPLVQIDTEATPPEGAGETPRAFVLCDHAGVAATAAEELLSLGRKCHVFVPILRPRTWTNRRAKPFLAKMRKAGHDVRIYEPKTEWGWAKEREALGKWLAGLPRPMAIFAGNDLLAKFTLGACQGAGLDVPGDAAILGTDDDETLCLSTTPALSSVRIDFEGAGRMAVERMAALMERKRAPKVVHFGAVGVARRGSTRLDVLGPAAGIAAGLDFIADHHYDPFIGVRDVAAAIGVGRRHANRLFRKARGKSVRESIEEKRMEHVRLLLKTTSLPIRAIAEECGFASGPYLSRIFAKRHGMPPGEWRAENSTTPSEMNHSHGRQST